MAHLIQPIDIGGTKYCVQHGATTPKWRTVSLLDYDAELTGPENGDSWTNPEGGSGMLVNFGTCCLWKATVRFTPGNEIAGVGSLGDIRINGTYVFVFGGGAPEVQEFEVDLNSLGLMGRPCGNIWELYMANHGTIEIIDVTFGPPPLP